MMDIWTTGQGNPPEVKTFICIVCGEEFHRDEESEIYAGYCIDCETKQREERKWTTQ